MRVEIFKSASGDCSNNGISANHNYVVVVGEGLPECTGWEGLPRIRIEKHTNDAVRAVPVTGRKEHHMFGGCYIAYSDSRFTQHVEKTLGSRFYGAIALHDRVE